VTLFRRGEFTGAAGQVLPFKIECDSLTYTDWECIAYVGAQMLRPFGRVIGVPRGGLPLASAMAPYVTPGSLTPLVVDDVWTTGKSVCASAPDCPWIGFVAFARGPLPRNVMAFATITRAPAPPETR
jgi:orotate phosphoribosyltransferase